jgi:hypothetical protein
MSYTEFMARIDRQMAEFGETRTPITYKFFDPQILVISFKEGGEHMKLEGVVVPSLKALAEGESVLYRPADADLAEQAH